VQLTFTRLEDVLDQLPFLAAELLVTRDDVAQLFPRDRLALGVGIAAEEPDDSVRRRREEPDERPEGRGHAVEDGRDEQRGPLCPLQRQPLRHQLAEHDGEVGDDQGDRHQRERLGDARRDPRVLERRCEVAGQAGCAEGSGEKAGERDAHLDGGEEPVGVVVQLGHPPATRPALGDAAHLSLAQRDQRDLGGGEEGADPDEHEDECEDGQRPAHGAPPRNQRCARLGQPSMAQRVDEPLRGAGWTLCSGQRCGWPTAVS
jgi:hypothetical protein